ncbi:hypothetical protein ACFQ6E_38690 [Streptomyces sp. NPDC056462]|uniref:hypothetical protein n=1 Tax=Streptomyces sp. NPDC056462 TaxID=3345826 RepID=UPI00367582C6
MSTAMVRRNIKHVATRALANTTTQASTEPPPARAQHLRTAISERRFERVTELFAADDREPIGHGPGADHLRETFAAIRATATEMRATNQAQRGDLRGEPPSQPPGTAHRAAPRRRPRDPKDHLMTPAAVSAGTEQALREATERLFTGQPTRTGGKLTKNNLWREAGVSRATMNRATSVLADWDNRVGQSPATLLAESDALRE